MTYVFVYGTLRNGEPANHLLNNGADCVKPNSRLTGDIITMDEDGNFSERDRAYRLLAVPPHGQFPAIVHVKDDGSLSEECITAMEYNPRGEEIRGDLYCVNDQDVLKALDNYEGYPMLYKKAAGSCCGVYAVYYYMELDLSAIRQMSVIHNNDWTNREGNMIVFDEYVKQLEDSVKDEDEAEEAPEDMEEVVERDNAEYIRQRVEDFRQANVRVNPYDPWLNVQRERNEN